MNPLMSICDSDTRNQVQSTTKFMDLEMKLDSMGLLVVIKRMAYTRGTSDLNIMHEKGHMNLRSLYQERFQDIQDFRDQYLAMRKVCDEIELHFLDAKVMQGLYSTQKARKNIWKLSLKKLWMR